jgi:hypothetical protein
MFEFLFRRRKQAPAASRVSPEQSHASLEKIRADSRAKREHEWKHFLQTLPYPYEIFAPGGVESAFDAASLEGQTKGFRPLLFLPGFSGCIRKPPSVLDIDTLPSPLEYFQRMEDELYTDIDFALFDGVKEVLWNHEPDRLYLVDMQSNAKLASPYSEIALAQIPCEFCWEIPLFADFGPPSDEGGRTMAEEVSIQKEWYDRFGAELCCIGEHSWQFRVRRPPQTHGEAVELLRQHYLYSHVDGADDSEHIENGAASLRAGSNWWFGWP